MAVMTAQPPLPLIPDGARPIGAAAAIVEDADGGRVFVHGNLAFAWDAGDTTTRRFAAAALTRIKAATQLDVADAFAVKPASVRRWEAQLADAGVTGLLAEPKGPKRKSKLTAHTVATIRRLREAGATYRTIATETGVSSGSIRNALTDTVASADTEAEAAVVNDTEVSAGVDAEVEVEVVCAATAFDASPGSGPVLVPEPEPECEVVSAAAEPVVPVLADPPDRGVERAMAAFGMIAYAPPVFTPCARAPLAGLFLAIPALAGTGLLDTAHTTYPNFPNGFYSLDTMLCESVLRALLGQTRAEGATRIDPTALGRVLGLDRAPEVKTIRRKIAYLAEAEKAGDWITAMAAAHAAARPDQAGVLYVDGHVRAYQGTRTIAKTHVARLKFPAPATVETWVCDAAGDPLLVVIAEPAASLAAELRRLIPDMRAVVGDDRRVLVGFDRGGWSPALFADLSAAGFDTLTWRKGATTEIAADLFTEHTHTDEHGRTRTFTLADTEVDLPIGDGPREGEVFGMRQISLHDPARTRQMHILTTRTDLTAGEIRYRMGSRWRQENYFRYARMRFDLDSHDTYDTSDDDPDRMVPNPAKRPAYQQVDKARRALHHAETRRDRELLQASTPEPGTSVTLTSELVNTINADVHTAQAALDTAAQTHKTTPARLPLSQVNPGQQILDTETKLIHHAIRMAAFNTAQTLARAILTHTGYARGEHEAHTLIRTALAGTGDIIPEPETRTLHIRLDPLPAPRHTAAIAELCHALNNTHTVYPGTTLTMRYSTKPHR